MNNKLYGQLAMEYYPSGLSPEGARAKYLVCANCYIDHSDPDACKRCQEEDWIAQEICDCESMEWPDLGAVRPCNESCAVRRRNKCDGYDFNCARFQHYVAKTWSNKRWSICGNYEVNGWVHSFAHTVSAATITEALEILDEHVRRSEGHGSYQFTDLRICLMASVKGGEPE